MVIYNTSNCIAFFCVESNKILLKPGDSIQFNCSKTFFATLKHDYNSTALSINEIASDNMDDSAVSLLMAPHKKPYFNLVLDSTYKINCSNEATIRIYQETIRPIYACSYDRLYLQVSDGSVKEITYTFSEKKKFENHYFTAISRSNRRIVDVLLIVLLVTSIPLTLLCFLINGWIGIIVTFLTIVSLLFVRLLGFGIVKMIVKADCMMIFSNFESNKIAKYFSAKAYEQ